MRYDLNVLQLFCPIICWKSMYVTSTPIISSVSSIWNEAQDSLLGATENPFPKQSIRSAYIYPIVSSIFHTPQRYQFVAKVFNISMIATTKKHAHILSHTNSKKKTCDIWRILGSWMMWSERTTRAFSIRDEHFDPESQGSGNKKSYSNKWK